MDRKRRGFHLGAVSLLLGTVLLPPPDLWQPRELPKVRRATRYTVVREREIRAVRAESRCSASVLVHRLSGVDPEVTPLFSWQWKVPLLPGAENERTREGDDFGARVYVLFPPEDGALSFWLRWKHAFFERLYGEELPGSALNYVWTNRLPRGTRWDNPFVPTSKMISLGAGPLRTWRREVVDLVGDYRRAFGREPPPPMAVGLMTDSDNSCGDAEAFYGDFRFLDRSERPSRGPESPGTRGGA